MDPIRSQGSAAQLGGVIGIDSKTQVGASGPNAQRLPTDTKVQINLDPKQISDGAAARTLNHLMTTDSPVLQATPANLERTQGIKFVVSLTEFAKKYNVNIDPNQPLGPQLQTLHKAATLAEGKKTFDQILPPDLQRQIGIPLGAAAVGYLVASGQSAKIPTILAALGVKAQVFSSKQKIGVGENDQFNGQGQLSFTPQGDAKFGASAKWTGALPNVKEGRYTLQLSANADTGGNFGGKGSVGLSGKGNFFGEANAALNINGGASSNGNMNAGVSAAIVGSDARFAGSVGYKKEGAASALTYAAELGFTFARFGGSASSSGVKAEVVPYINERDHGVKLNVGGSF